MSRFLVACSLVAALTSSASAQRFAQPPPASAPIPADLDAELHRPVTRVQPPSRATLRIKLAENRAANLARFRAYQIKGVFPSNTFSANKLNVWIDAAGNLCAAATIIDASGQADLVQQVGRDNNFIRLADVTDGPLMDWILTSGLTQAEIAAIQEPFVRVGEEDLRWVRDPRMQPRPPVIDPRRRAAEDMRLVKKYKQVDAMIVKQQQASLDAAVDRLLLHPTLAWQLLQS